MSMKDTSAAKQFKKQESGAIMLEGMIVVIITLFILIWLLGLGFLYYQRYITTVVTNDAAVKVASTYRNPTSDIIMGYVTTEDLSNRDLYRNFNSDSEASDLRETNEDRAASYIKYILDLANFTGVVKDVQVELTLVTDSLVRKHVEITTTCTFDTPFGEGLELFGMSGTNTYSVTAYADCTDFSDYIATVDYELAWSVGRFTEGTGLVDSIVKLINTCVKYYNHQHS